MALTSINADGWSATYGSPPTEFDPVSSPETFTVARSGFNSSGTGVTVNDTITLMKRVRQPNSTTLTSDQVALSDFVFSGETISGVTNNSTRTYPKPIAMWLNHDRERATGGSHTFRLAVSHHFARSGRPVAAVKIEATDGTTTVSGTSSSMVKVDYAASGLSVAVYEVTLSLGTLTNNALLTIDAVIYPWVGNSYRASVDGATYPSMSFTTLRVLNDVSYGTAYAYVSTSGNDGTGVVSATASTAQASPYLTVAAAASAIQTFNNSNYSRNNVSGGIIRLEAGTFTHSSFSARAVGDLPLVIEAANVANKATTIYQSPASNVFNGLCDFVKFKDITIRRQNSTNAVFLDSGAGSGSTNMLVLENVTLSANGFGNSSLFMYEVGRVWLINVDGDDMGIGDPFSTANKQINIIGSTVGAGKCAYNIAASKDLNAAVTTDQIGAGNRPASKGRGIFHSHLTNNGSNIVSVENALGTDGFAVVGSVIEQRNTSTTALTMLGGTAGTAQNLLIHGTTVVGGRILYAYNDVSGTGALVRDGSIRNSVFRSYNCKGDIFANNAANIGNWPAAYKVGHRANAYLRGSDSGDTPGAGEWIGEVFALNDLGGTDASPIATDWSDDQSGGGGGAGDGEYIPGASTGLQNVPSGAALFAYDLYGNAVADDGTAYVGAGQQAAAAATDVDLDAGSYTLTGYALSVTTVQNVDLDAGSYSLTGNALDITTATQVDLDTGTYTLTGYPLAVTTIQNVDLDAGSYSLTGNDLGVTLTTVVDLDAGSYSLTGRDLSVTTVQNIDLDAGSYTLTGNDLAVDVGGDVTVNLDAGSYTLAGHDLGITTTTAVNLDAGSYALTGNPLSLAFDVNLATGAYTLTGHDLSIDAPIAVDLETGEYTLTGQDLSVQIPSGAQPGGFVPKPIIYVDAKGKPVTLKKAVREAVKAAPYREKERTKQAAARVRAAVDENEAYDRMRADLRTLASAVARVDNEIAAFLRAEAQRADDDEVATILLLAA